VRIPPEVIGRHQDRILAETLDHAEIEGQEAFLSDAFCDLVLDDLEQDGRWPDYQLASLRARGAAVDAWGIDDERKVLHLALTDFSRVPEGTSLPPGEVRKLMARLTGFLERARAGRVTVPDHSPVNDLLDVIASTARYDTVECYLLSHRVSTVTATDTDVIDGVTVNRRVWDLETIRRSRNTGARPDPIVVDLSGTGRGLPYLVHTLGQEVTTYLLFVPATLLAGLYQEHGGRLLERNVRAFLSVRGKVNRGIRDTLRIEPERFLAYNNGLTATASSVTTTDHTITGLRDLQIVNGGQTTASLAAAAREGNVDLGTVSVQMKLVVVGDKLLDEIVPSISRYANRQNAVQESDLSSNHEYLRRMEEASRSEWTPAIAAGRPTKWYFERARGSYTVDQGSGGNRASEKRFLDEYPKNQRIGKNELALYENTWSRLPHLVSRGGQKNFVEFMTRLPEPPDGDEETLDAWYRERFRDLVARAILFKTADRAVMAEYGGTYKRPVVAYTVSWLLEHHEPPDQFAIWRTQSPPPGYTEAVEAVAGPLKVALIDSASGRNITEWAKQPACWAALRSRTFDFEPFVDRSTGDRTAVSSTVFESFLRQPGRPLADVIGTVHGEPIDGSYRRYRRARWRHVGDTGVPATAGSTYHLYSAPLNQQGGEPYVFSVVVDFPLRLIRPVDQLEGETGRLVRLWLDERGIPQ
jgi:hypothetical protein